MARLSRIVLPKVPHHITQRGVRSMHIFFQDKDRKEYLQLLKKHGERTGIEFVSYCLMDNHIHLIVIPHFKDSLRKGIGEAHRLYTRMINSREKTKGYLFQGRFFSCPLDDVHLNMAVRYVENNPVRAKLCKRPQDYSWSSAAFHLGLIDHDPLVNQSDWLESASDWKQYLRQKETDIERLRLHFRTGRPLGNNSFLEYAEQVTGKALTPKKAGRPKKI